MALTTREQARFERIKHLVAMVDYYEGCAVRLRQAVADGTLPFMEATVLADDSERQAEQWIRAAIQATEAVA